ncbi:MAG: hypothetical protein K2J75_02810 [Clostridia bacterium]|nr:hypothetical protein [Clostridia bacterium]
MNYLIYPSAARSEQKEYLTTGAYLLVRDLDKAEFDEVLGALFTLPFGC